MEETAPIPAKPGRSWIDYAIWVAAAAIVAVLAWLGWSMWSTSQLNAASSPAARAVAQMTEVVRKRPNDALARVKFAEALLAAGRRDDAVQQYREAIKLDPKGVDGPAGLALVAMNEQDYRKAIGHWDKVIKTLRGGEFAARDTRLEAAYYYRALAEIELKRFDDAVRDLKEAVRIKDTGADTHYALSMAYKGLGTRDKQRAELKIALAFDPKMPEANYELGLIALADGDRAAAAEFFRSAADAAPNAPLPEQALAKLGSAGDFAAKAETALKSGKAKEAVVLARIATAIDPADPEIRLLLARTYEAAGAPKLAVKAYERAAELEAASVRAKAALKRLGASGK
jgi:tetratricopeptide (TPR) repeat protein